MFSLDLRHHFQKICDEAQAVQLHATQKASALRNLTPFIDLLNAMGFEENPNSSNEPHHPQAILTTEITTYNLNHSVQPKPTPTAEIEITAEGRKTSAPDSKPFHLLRIVADPFGTCTIIRANLGGPEVLIHSAMTLQTKGTLIRQLSEFPDLKKRIPDDSKQITQPPAYRSRVEPQNGLGIQQKVERRKTPRP